MPEASPAILGDKIVGARSFKFAFNGSAGASVPKAVIAGSYAIVSSVDVWLTMGLTAASPTAAVPGATQPAAGAENNAMFLPANQQVGLTVPGDLYSIAVLGDGTSGGNLYVSGPFECSTMR